LALFLFYFIRGAIVQQICTFTCSENFLFDFTGFFSLTVAMSRSNDFFFSGHVGICVLLALFFKEFKFYKIYKSFILVILFQFFCLISLRGHYIIDLIFGVIFAHYFFLIADINSKDIDIKFPFIGQVKAKRKIILNYNFKESDIEFQTKLV
jgi:hypothetical protein